jgi:hypothetical protein
MKSFDMKLPFERIGDSPEAKESYSRETLSEENCCVCGYARQAQILLTCALSNKWICRTCASHVKAQVECIRTQEEMQATGKEILLRRRLNLSFPSTDNSRKTDTGRMVVVPTWHEHIESLQSEER